MLHLGHDLVEARFVVQGGEPRIPGQVLVVQIAKLEVLVQASMELGEAIYKAQAEEASDAESAEADDEAAADAAATAAEAGEGGAEDIVDADLEEVDDANKDSSL